MARAHRLSGYDSDDEEDEFEELQEKKANNDLVRPKPIMALSQPHISN